MKLSRIFIIVLFALFMVPAYAQHDQSSHENEHADHSEHTEAAHADHQTDAGQHGEEELDMGAIILHHIGDANEYHVWKDVHMPLPCILYAKGEGFSFFMSSKFEHGHSAYDGFVMNHGRVNRIKDASFAKGTQHIDGIKHVATMNEEGKEEDVYYAVSHGHEYELEGATIWDGGMLGGKITSFYDFSITRNVFTMLLATIILLFLFRAIKKGYARNEGKAPSGIQSFMEPLFVFMRDEVVEPMIGQKHYERFMPFLLTLFFFILTLNLLGLMPFFPGGGNVTGNISVTLALAVITALVVNLNGKGYYWKHTLWMPGVPALIKIFILTPVEILGLFIKPFALMIRLFANITAGHIIILSLVGLIFIFGQQGQNYAGATAGVVIGGLFTAFMNIIEVIVAFVQAFVFTILAASYIGAAVEEPHHH